MTGDDAGDGRGDEHVMLTLSIIKADKGGFVGHSSVHPSMVDEATTMPAVSARLADRWEQVEAPAVPAHVPGA
jgi:fructose 1,6-bisphosphatase